MPLLHHWSVLVSAAWVARSRDAPKRPASSLRRTRAAPAARVCPSATRKSSGRKVYTPCELRQWDFDSRAVAEPADQIAHLRVMLEHLGVQPVLGISSHECTALLLSIQDGYARTSDLHFTRSYHDFHHAFDVAQTLFALFGFAEHSELQLTSLERVVLLLAAVGHDIAHPGVSNRFLVATKHPLALAYGYTSVLESMHAAKTMALLERHNVLRNLTPNQRTVAQHLLVTSILGTDVAQHDRLLHSVREIVASEIERPIRHRGIHTRARIGSFLLHCADISNATKPFPIAAQWTDRIMTEFFEQGEAEKRLGLAVSPHCDAATTNVPDLQIQFITFAILPTFTLLESLLPRAHIAIQHARANVSEWERKKAQDATAASASVCGRSDETSNDATRTRHPRDSVRVLVSRHASAYWQTVSSLLLRYVGWTCIVLCVPLVNCVLGRTSSASRSGSGAAGAAMPTCVVAVIVLHVLLGGDFKSSSGASESHAVRLCGHG